MNPLSALFAPILVLLPGLAAPSFAPPSFAGAGIGGGERSDPRAADASADEAGLVDGVAAPASEPEPRTLRELAERFREQTARQVRIEQRLIIRVAPSPAPRPPVPDIRRNLFADMPGRGGSGSHFEERSTARCVAVAGIAGVQPDGPSRLLLFMRDQRIVSAALDKACNARDFYSGFLVERSTDGLICSGRDKLLSRSGSNCGLGRMRQLVEVADDDQ